MNTIIPFTSLKMIQKGNLKVPEAVTFKDKTGNTHEIIYNNDGFYLYDGGKFSPAAYNKFYSANNIIYGSYIRTKEENKGIGTVLHLAKVIEMLENGCSAISIDSLNTAVMFHAKFGFRADFKTEKEADYALRTIISNCFKSPKFGEASTRAFQIISSERKPDYIESVNGIFNEFLDKAVNSKWLDPREIYISDDIYGGNILYSMKLTRNQVLKNCEFYNNLFKRYGIDYRIKD